MKSSPPYFSDLYHLFILIINILFLFLPHIIINIIIYINLIFLYFFFIINIFKVKNIISIFFYYRLECNFLQFWKTKHRDA